MSSRTSLLRLAQPIASSSRLPLRPIRSLIHSPTIPHHTRPFPPRRPASTASATPTPPNLPPLPPRPSLRVTPPSLPAIHKEGYLDPDVQLIPPLEASLVITPDAIRQLVSITSREPPDTLGRLVLRCGVSSGGCHGYQYTMELTEERGVDDYVMQPEGVDCIPVVVDLVSLGLLKGATLHHATELIGSSFRIQDNPQAKEGGACGCGVSWEAKI